MKVPITPHHLENRYYAPPPIAITGNRLTLVLVVAEGIGDSEDKRVSFVCLFLDG